MKLCVDCKHACEIKSVSWGIIPACITVCTLNMLVGSMAANISPVTK